MHKERPNRTKRRAGIAAGALAAMLAIGGTVAYLTASDSVVNRFELDTNMQTKVVEPGWVPEAGKGIVPTQTVAKDPAVKNTGTVSQYVALKVKAPVFTGKVFDPATNTVSDVTDADLFTWSANEGWTLVQTEGPDAGFKTYTYVYENVVGANETTPSLFDAVTEANLLEDVGIDATSITVEADAIQSMGFSSAREAWEASVKQGGGEIPSEPDVVYDFNVPEGSVSAASWDGAEPAARFDGPGQVVDVPKLVRDGYDFRQWRITADPDRACKVNYDGTVTITVPEGFSGQVTLQAVWEAKASAIVFDTLSEHVTVNQLDGFTDDPVEDTSMPSASQVGYVFKGWYPQNGTESGEWGEKVESLPTLFPAGGVTYYAKWEGKAAYIQFATGGGSAIGTMAGKTGESLLTEGEPTPMPETTRYGYEFAGWFTTSSFTGDAVTHLPVSYPAGVTVYYAKWVELKKATLTFDMGDSGIAQIEPMDVVEGAVASKPSGIAVENGYEAGFWSDAECTQAFDWSQPISSDTKIYVSKVAQPARIVFNTNCGSEVETIEGYTGMDLGVDAELPTTVYAAKSRAVTPSYEFDAWYTENGAQEDDLVGNDADWGDPVTSMAFFGYEMPAGETVLNARYVDTNDESKVSFAVLTTDDALNFYRRDSREIPSAGTTYDGCTVKKTFRDVGQSISKTPATCLHFSDEEKRSVRTIEYKDVFRPKYLTSYFKGFTGLVSADLSNIDTSALVSTEQLFFNCPKLETVTGLSDWNVRNIESMKDMFRADDSLSDIGELSRWEFNGCKLDGMFYGCKNLPTVGNVAGWNMRNVSSIRELFAGCETLESIDSLAGWSTSNITDMFGAFKACYKLTTIDGLNGWDTSSVTDMGDMFYNCKSLEDISGASSWNTKSVTSLYRVFGATPVNCDVDLSGWDVSNVTSFVDAFSFLYSSADIPQNYEKSLNLSGWDFSSINKATSHWYEIFGTIDSWVNIDCSNWKFASYDDVKTFSKNIPSCKNHLDMSNWDVSGLTDANDLFGISVQYACRSLDLSGWDTSNMTSMANMFANCKCLESITGLAAFDVSNVRDMSCMFKDTVNFDISESFEGWDVSNVTNTKQMFSGCASLSSLTGLDSWNTTAFKDLSSMFYGCHSLSSLNELSHWNVSNVETISYTFIGCNGLTSVDLSGWNTASAITIEYVLSGNALVTVDLSNWSVRDGVEVDDYGNVQRGKIYRLVEGTSLDIFRLANGHFALDDEYNIDIVPNVRVVDLSGCIGVDLLNLPGYLDGCTAIEELCVSDWNAARATNTNVVTNILKKVPNLKKADFSGWNMGGVASFSRAFMNNAATQLEELDLSDWNTEKCTTMANMFQGCKTIRTINLSGWNTASVTTLSSMFYLCDSLEEVIGLKDWTTASVTNMQSAFAGCKSLSNVEGIQKWNTSRVTNMQSMFEGCESISSLDLTAWSTDSIAESLGIMGYNGLYNFNKNATGVIAPTYAA